MPTPCEAGKYTRDPKKACQDCAAGKYQNDQGGESCKDCTPGKYCKQGAKEEDVCAGGFFCPVPSKQSNCSTVGAYCPQNGRSLNDAQRVDARGLFADCFRQLLQVPPRRAGGTMEPALSLL